MAFEFLQLSEKNHIVTITLYRPDKRHALHGPMVIELITALKKIASDENRVLVLRSQGEYFCAGGDLAWMKKITGGTSAQNDQDTQLLADLFYQLYTFPKPTVCVVQGTVLGGGMGLVAACDIVVASKEALFGLPEVKMGLTPSIVSPYIIKAMGYRFSQYYFLTGELFDAERAYQLGLVHQLTDKQTLEARSHEVINALLQQGTKALIQAKRLLHNVSGEKITADLVQYTASHLAEIRTTPEAQEGLSAFIEKRKPNWIKK
ncbi:MAG TPA: enoyl-CoA hydratase-related protein [Gammaproteobacteria bacterium]|jgi:methylglutaconyl-CoA hydratase|nr:enoyl-CoA hydratase-related protein [Gammaproteobacteria bacterium]